MTHSYRRYIIPVLFLLAVLLGGATDILASVHPAYIDFTEEAHEEWDVDIKLNPDDSIYPYVFNDEGNRRCRQGGQDTSLRIYQWSEPGGIKIWLQEFAQISPEIVLREALPFQNPERHFLRKQAWYGFLFRLTPF